MTSVLTRNGRLRVWVVPTLIVLIVVCAAAAMLIGRFSVSLEDVVAALRARFWGGPAVPPRVNSVVFDLRAPRIIVAILIGGGLSVAGASFQSLFSNPLATPDTLGVAAGTCVGAVIALLLDWNLIGVQDAAAAVSLSPSHFSRQFKARTGYSPYEYIVLRRIDKAKYMLASTELSVKEIAYATGYNSEENFIHSFRKNVGVAPGIFRKYPV